MIHLSASTLWSAELCCHSLSKLALMMCLDLAKTTCLKSLGKGKFQNKAFIIESCFKFLKQPFLKKTSITGYDYIFCRQFRSQLLDNRKRNKTLQISSIGFESRLELKQVSASEVRTSQQYWLFSAPSALWGPAFNI